MGLPQVRAQPSGAHAIHGQASLSQQGSKLVVTTQNGVGTNHSAINWQSFSVPGGTTTHFQQPGASSLSINRVVGNDPSSIFGTLSSNGRLVLVNPAGIAVGAGAVVDTAGFTASTLRMSDANALAGRLVFGGDGLGGGALDVNGQIVARSGDVVLIAPNVQVGSQALVQSPNGATVLAAGQKVELTGRGLEGIRLELQAPGDQALNLGTLQGDAVGIFAGQLKHSGLIQATGVSTEGGKVVLKAGAGDALVEGRISAISGNKGGSIDVLGQRVGLLAGAALDVSGDQGGGFVRVGGDFQGKNADVPNAQRTYVARSATINADARINGDGGRVIVWADDQTQSFGTISARGGAQGGDGGFVEVSGKHRLAFDSIIDTRAPMGKVGTLLLDPDNITVSAAPSPAVLSDADAFSDTGDVTISAATISNATSDVLLQATNQIDFAAEISMVTEGVGLTAQAGGSINVDAPITTKGGAVVLSAGDPGALGPSDSALSVSFNIDTTGGGAYKGADVTLQSRLSDVDGNSVYISAVDINAGTGDVRMFGQAVDVLGSIITGDSIEIAPDGGIEISGAILAASGGITLRSAGPGVEIGIYDSTMATSAGGILVKADAGNVDIGYSSLSTAGGGITIVGGASSAAPFNDGVWVHASTINAGTGAISISGATEDAFSYGVAITGNVDLSAGAGAAIFGENQSTLTDFGAGILVDLMDCGCMGLTGAGALSMTGVSAGDGTGIEFNGAIVSRSGAISLKAVNGALSINSSTIENSGSGQTLLEAVTTGPAPAPGIYIDGLSVVRNMGTSPGEIHLVADSLDLQGQVDSGVARTVIKPTTASRGIALGSSDDINKLALGQIELLNVNAGIIVVGGDAYTGGLSIDGSIGVGFGSLSLIQSSAASITQAGGATIFAGQLNAHAGSVTLTEANHVSVISGRATNPSGAGFSFSNDGGADLTVGAVDGVAGIHSGTGPESRSAVALSAANGSIWGFEAIKGSSLVAMARDNVMLTNPDNDLTAIDAAAVTADVVLTNNGPTARLAASAGGSVFYRGLGALTVGTIAAGASVALEADSIAAEPGKGPSINAFNDGRVFLRAISGGIGDGTSPMRIASNGGVFAQALGTGGNIYLSTPSTAFKLYLDTAGLASVTGAGAGTTLELGGANVGGALGWSGFDSATLGFSVTPTTVSGDSRVQGTALDSTSTPPGSTGGRISAGGPITAEGDVILAGILAPGGSGGVSTMSVSGNLDILEGAVLEFDFNGASHDKIDVAGNVVFPATPGASTLIANAVSRPPGGSYTLISGATSGELPAVKGNVIGASLSFGSLIIDIPGSAAEQIAALVGDAALAQQIMAETGTNPLVTFTTLLQQEEERQAEDDKGLDNLVDNNQCRR